MTLEEAIRIARMIMPVRFKHWKAIKVLINSAYKQIPMMAVRGPIAKCPACNADPLLALNYCPYCGQKIDWKEDT